MALATQYIPRAVAGTSPSRYFIADVYASDRPTSGLHAGDTLYALDTASFYIASNATTWNQVGAGGPPTGTAGGDLGGAYPTPDVLKVHGVTYPATPTTTTVPVVTATNTVTYQTVPNAALTNSTLAFSSAAGFSVPSSPVALGGTAAIGATTDTVRLQTLGLGMVTPSLGLQMRPPGADGILLRLRNTANTDTLTYDTSIPRLATNAKLLLNAMAGSIPAFDFYGTPYQFQYAHTADPGMQQPMLYVHGSTLGNSTNNNGMTGLWIDLYDDASVTGSTKPSFTCLHLSVNPRVDRTTPGIDYISALSIQNMQPYTAEAAVVFNATSLTAHLEWQSLIELGCYCGEGLLYDGRFTRYGLDFVGRMNGGAGSATYDTGAVMRLPNNATVVARNQAASADLALFKLNTSNLLEFGVPVLVPMGPTTIRPAGILSATAPGNSVSNTATDTDFPSLFTLPATLLVANRVVRLSLEYAYTAGATPVSQQPYLKITDGTSTGLKVFVPGGGMTPAAGVTRSWVLKLVLYGTAAAGGAVPVHVSPEATHVQNVNHNTIAPQNWATNAGVQLIPGVTWGATGGGDTVTLRHALIELVA